MDELSFYNKFYYYMFSAIAIAIIFISILSFNAYLIMLSLIALFLSAIFLHSGHIINNLLIKRSKIIEIKNGFKLSHNLISASKRNGRSYVSASLALLRTHSNSNYKSESIKELLESIKEPFEFSISLNELDKKRILEDLDTKKRSKEITLSRIKSNSYDKINYLRRQIELLDKEITNISSGGKSFDVLIKLKSISSAENEYEAETETARNIEILASKFSAAIGLDYEILKGEELLNFLGN